MPSITNPTSTDQRSIFFFDVDDCLYPRSLGVAELMYERLEKFVMENLSLTKEEALELNMKYFEEHTLTAVGLAKLHNIDPMVFNEQNDDSLPMDALLSPDKELRNMLLRFDTSKVKLWLFTNAHVTHGQRVVKLLGVDDLFEGITYCDYANGIWPLKPHLEMFVKAEKDAGAVSPNQCYFVDDSPRNCEAALKRGWQVVQISDPKAPRPESAVKPGYPVINHLDELHKLFPYFSK